MESSFWRSRITAWKIRDEIQLLEKQDNGYSWGSVFFSVKNRWEKRPNRKKREKIQFLENQDTNKSVQTKIKKGSVSGAFLILGEEFQSNHFLLGEEAVVSALQILLVQPGVHHAIQRSDFIAQVSK